MPARQSLYRRVTRRLVRTIAPDRQTLVLFKSGAKGVSNAGGGLLTAWDGWTAPLARGWAVAFGGSAGEITKPSEYPVIDLGVEDPIAAIISAPEFAKLAGFFAVPNPGEQALVSAATQALLYALVCGLRSDHVVEIGTYQASTSRAICRALQANGHGLLHTVDPFNSGLILRLIRRWPTALRDRLCYYPAPSMEFFNLALSEGLTADLVFVDGNHDYEAALFDIQSAARILRPGGFIAIDDVSQAGPFYAAQDFIKAHPRWRECGHALEARNIAFAFDRGRSTIAGTDLCVIRAPSVYAIGRRPATHGAQEVVQSEIGGIALDIARPASGTLYAQYVVRVFDQPPSETTTDTSIELRDALGPVRLPLPWVFSLQEAAATRTIELWLSWSGDSDIELSKPPALF
jgi:predicted O-methyltransferase YrrM